MKSYYESGRVGSFGALMPKVREQIQAGSFPPPDREQVEEIVRIIAEMMILPEEASVAIGGIKMPAGYVREIYGILEHDHVDLVLQQYKKQTHAIRFPKSYFRTALYNAAFELESRVTNDVAQEFRS